ncbi:MAG: hypothetical protein ACI9KE_004430, partial [Polyangiales bacterium]
GAALWWCCRASRTPQSAFIDGIARDPSVEVALVVADWVLSSADRFDEVQVLPRTLQRTIEPFVRSLSSVTGATVTSWLWCGTAQFRRLEASECMVLPTCGATQASDQELSTQCIALGTPADATRCVIERPVGLLCVAVLSILVAAWNMVHET